MYIIKICSEHRRTKKLVSFQYIYWLKRTDPSEVSKTLLKVLHFTRKPKYKVLNMIVYHIFPDCTNTYHLLQLSMLCLCSSSSIIRACKQLAASKRMSMWRSHSLWYSFAAISESGLGRVGN